MKTYSSFSSVSTAKPIDANGNLLNNFGYHAGRAGRHRGGAADVRVADLRVAARLQHLTDMAGNKRLIIATAAFRNEPYQ